MASEVAQAGIMRKLMDLIDSEDDRLSHQAFTVFLPLTDHPRSAALIGASDGVDFFLSHLDSSRRHIIRKDLISGLCQLSKEAVNRAKIRLLDGLKVFLESLQDDDLAEVQDRVISCLVNFLYDDVSLSAMLEGGLVDVLLTHLQRCGNYTSDLSVSVYESAVDLMQWIENSSNNAAPSSRSAAADTLSGDDLSFHMGESSAEGSTCDFGSEEKLQQDELKACPETSQSEKLSSQTSETLRTESKSVDSVRDIAIKLLFDVDSTITATVSDNPREEEDAFGDGGEDLVDIESSPALVTVSEERSSVAGTAEKAYGEETESEVDSEADPPDTAGRQMYSMNSPTYQAETTWRMEDYHRGVTCLFYNTSLSPGSGTTCFDDSGSSVRFPYSPLSTLSYFSPSQSNQVSPSRSSPASSPAYSCATTLSPVHSPCGSEVASSPCRCPCCAGGVKSECLSPRSPSLGVSSPDWEQASSPFEKFDDPTPVFSSSEDDCAEDEDQRTDTGTGGGHSADGGMPSDSKLHFKLFMEKNYTAEEQAKEACWSQKPTADKTASQRMIIPQKSEDPISSQASEQVETSNTTVPPVQAVHDLDTDTSRNIHEDSFVKTASIEFDPTNSKATTHHIHSLDQPSVSWPAQEGMASEGAKWNWSHKENQQFLTRRHQSKNRFFKVHESSKDVDSEGELGVKGRKLQSRQGRHAPITQKNILILLSRLSVCDDLSKHLATSKVICCLTDYLAFATEPHDRCVRVLSRILSSPHCLAPLLMMYAPATLVKTLILDSHSTMVSRDAVLKAQGGQVGASRSSVSRRLSVEEQNMRSVMRRSKGVRQSLSTEAGLLMSRMRSNPSSNSTVVKSFSAPKDGHTSFESGKKPCSSERGPTVDKPDPHDSEPESHPKKSGHDLAKVGAKLLADLSSQAMSPYGEGVILHTFHRQPSSHQLAFATSLLFLQTHWPRERRQKFLFHKGGLDRVLSALCIPHAGSPVIKDVMVLGLVFLARDLLINPRFQPSDTQHLLYKAVETLKRGQTGSQESDQRYEAGELETGLNGDRSVCQYATARKDLQIVVGEGRSCRSIAANRETLSRNSQVFEAMLQGSYIESTQSKVSISDTSSEALTPVLHFLHGCGEQCPTLKSLVSNNDVTSAGADTSMETHHQDCLSPHYTLHLAESGQVSRKRLRLKHMLSVIALADQFLLPDLVGCLCAVVSTSLLDQTCVEEVLRFACFHSLSHLAEDCMKMLLSSSSVADIARCVITLAESEFGSELKAITSALLKRGVANTP